MSHPHIYEHLDLFGANPLSVYKLHALTVVCFKGLLCNCDVCHSVKVNFGVPSSLWCLWAVLYEPNMSAKKN